jgi:hypothetical protein
MKLVLVHNWCNEPESGVYVIPFEYESKEKFVFDILEKFKDKVWEEYGEKGWKSYEEVEIFGGVRMCKYDIDSIEHSVHSIEEWFDKHKEGLKVELEK